MSEVSPWSVIQSIAERRIEESMAKGDFDDLPGRGKPLELEDDSHVPPELRMAYKVLRNAGCVPPELAERKEISNLGTLRGRAGARAPDAEAAVHDPAGPHEASASPEP